MDFYRRHPKRGKSSSKKSDILNITCDHLNIDDVRWCVLINMHTPTTQLCPDTDEEHPEPTQWADTQLLRISSEAAAELLDILREDSWLVDARCTLPDCLVCGGMSLWYNDMDHTEQGIRCLNDAEHRSYSKLHERHTRADIWDNFKNGKFGNIDDYYEKESEDGQEG